LLKATRPGSYKSKAQYQNKVHNQLIFKSRPKLLNTNLVIEHFGYADEKVLLRKRMRTIKMINDSLKEDPNNHYLIQQLARAYFAIKDYKNSFYYSNIVAQKIIAKEIKVKPNHLFYLESLIIAAKSLVELERYESVEKYYATALKIFPNYIDALILSAEFYYHEGELKKAKEMLIKYLSVHDELLRSSSTIKLPPSNSFGMKLVALRFLILVLKELNQIKEFKPFLKLYLSLENDSNRKRDIESLLF
jgi:tetratricopeptide (TPR) repeat protein